MENREDVMFQIQNTLVSLDLAEEFFCCDLEACKGECCIEGDAGAPVTDMECNEIRKVLPIIEKDMAPRAIELVNEQGVSYVDEEGDLVTTILDGKNCALTCYGPGGICLCALECAYRRGETTWKKPISCALYPVRVTEYEKFTAVNYHKWNICKAARVKGKREGIRLYQFLKGPLTDRFGKDWYDELVLCCEAYLAEQQE